MKTMNMRRFVANLTEARKHAIEVITSRNDIARETRSNLLDATTNNMIEELNTIIVGHVDKDAFLKSLLEDAEYESNK